MNKIWMMTLIVLLALATTRAQEPAAEPVAAAPVVTEEVLTLTGVLTAEVPDAKGKETYKLTASGKRYGIPNSKSQLPADVSLADYVGEVTVEVVYVTRVRDGKTSRFVSKVNSITKASAAADASPSPVTTVPGAP